MSRIIERALSIINDNLKDQTTSFADPISIKPIARGGRLLEDEYPTHYLPHVGRQVMADGGDADPIGGALDVAQAIPETPMPSLRPTPPAPSVPSAEGRVRAPERKTNEIGHYSSAAEAAYALKQSKGPASQMIGALKNMPGVKPEEIKWSGVEDAFDPKEMITKDDLVNHFNKKLPDVEETVLRKQFSYPYREADEWQEAIDTAERRRNFDEAERLQRAWEEYEGHGAAFGGDKPPKFEQYSLPGGENYREVLLHLPTQSVSEEEARKILNAKPDAKLSQADIDYASRKVAQEYKSSHWDEPNVLGHLRMSDRTGPEGEKILHLEELQSDWGQAGRKKGFKDTSGKLNYNDAVQALENKRAELNKQSPPIEDVNEIHRQLEPFQDAVRAASLNDTALPAAPYVTSTQGWTDLGLKRALQEAAEGGYDKMIWTPGEEQAARYDLSKQINKIVVPVVKEDGSRSVRIDAINGLPIKMMVDKNGIVEGYGSAASQFQGKKLDEVVGKEIADKIMSAENPMSLEGEGLKVGGEGMHAFYDKMVPTQLSKMVKKLDPNARIEMGAHKLEDEGGKEVRAHVLHITPELRQKVLEGLPAYAGGGAVEDGDNKNNVNFETISDEDYRGSHRASDPDFGAPAWRLHQLYPEDIYSSNGFRYYADTGLPYDRKAYQNVVSLRNQPNKLTTMYRAVPKDANIKKINPGDWVTLTREYAKHHGESVLLGNYKILKQTVRARDLFTDADSIHEFGYNPQPRVSDKEIVSRMSEEEAKNKLEKLSPKARTTWKRALEERILPAKASGGDVENDIRLSPDIEAIDEMPDQAFTSENTSRNQIPALFNSPAFERKRGSRNLDYGGGAFDKGSEYLAQEHGVDSQVYDPFNREKEHNDFVLTGFKKEPADTATVANVLNVIAEPEARLHVIKQVHNHIKPDGKAYFTVYEGDGKEKGSGNSRMTRDGWQEYRPTHSYVEEIKQVFPDVRLSGKTIVASKKAAKAYGGAIIPGPKLTEENADDFARRLIAWTFATAPLFHKASGGSVIDDPLDVISKLRR